MDANELPDGELNVWLKRETRTKPSGMLTWNASAEKDEPARKGEDGSVKTSEEQGDRVITESKGRSASQSMEWPKVRPKAFFLPHLLFFLP